MMMTESVQNLATTNIIKDPTYDPAKFLYWLRSDVFKVKNDSQLAKALGISAVAVSKIRNRKIPVGLNLIVRVHDVTNRPVREIRDMLFIR